MATAVGRDCVSNCGGDEVTTPKPEPSCPPHHWSHSPTVGCYTCLKCRTAVYAHLDHGRYTEIEAEVAATVAAIAPKPEPTEDHLLARAAQIADLRHLLTFPKLGEWGMETLIDTLNQLIPELAENPVSHGTFHD
jgi:hypothetical protein